MELVERRLDVAEVAKEATVGLILVVVLWAAMVVTKRRELLASIRFAETRQAYDVVLNLFVYCRWCLISFLLR